jgi:hypothetical protein
MNKEREISMDQLTKQDIEDLIHCRKKITEQPKKEMSLSDGHWRNGMKLQSEDGKHDFIVFMRKNEDFEENFSIGLICLPKHIKGDILLFRCNGPHGPHILFDHHDRHHIHIANEEDIAAGLKAERTAYVTEEYASYWDALGYFLQKCNIMGAEKHFPDVFQKKLFIGSRGES